MENNQWEKEIGYALVTGATSGIGYELAKQAALKGYNLVLVANDEDRLATVSTEFKRIGATVRTINKDLSEECAAKEVYQETREMGIRINILINDAGQGQYGMFADVDLDRHMEIIRLNVMSLVGLTYYFLNDMLRHNEGKILQLGSVVSKEPMPMMSIYAATKAFILSFTEGLINELKDTNVTMTLLMPGATDTDFFHKADMEDTKVYREGKLASPEEVAEVAFEALLNGERRIVGPPDRIQVAMAVLTPDDVLAENQRKGLEPSDKPAAETRQYPEHQASFDENRSSR